MSESFGNREEVLDDASLFVSETDEKGNIIYVNESFTRISGYLKEELIGQPHNMIRHNFMPKAAFADLWNTASNGNNWTGVVINKTKSGGFYWVKANVFKSQNSNGSVKYISVRVKATQDEIDAAIKLYPTL